MDEETKAIIAAILGAIGPGSGNQASSGTTKNYIKLTPASAKALLQQAADDAQFMGKFSAEDINNFIKAFSEEANKQVEQVVREARQSVTPGATAEDIEKQISSLIQTSYPSFFKPTEFASNYVWSKINFKESATLGGKGAIALQTAQQIAKDFDLFTLSDAEVEDAAKKIAMGKLTAEQYKAQLSAKAAIEYPVFAERFKATPGATTKDFAKPVINMLAKIWEQDPDSIPMDNEIVQKWTRAGGPDGKQPAPTLAELTMMAKNHPNAEKTSWANEAARQSATALARALGGGV